LHGGRWRRRAGTAAKLNGVAMAERLDAVTDGLCHRAAQSKRWSNRVDMGRRNLRIHL